MKIQLKRSNVLSGGSAKEPTAAQMEYGEIAVNYNESDPVLFIKDSNDTIVRIAGANSSGGFDGDYESLTNKPTIGDGEITIKSGGVEVGTFTVNQEGTTEIDIPVASWGDIDEKPIYIDIDAPDSPSNGDLWVDLSECPPELKIWSDCSGTGQWEGIEGTPPLTVLTPVLSGNPTEGRTLISTLGQAVGGKEPFTYVYNFQDENDNVLQATSANTYTLASADIDKTVTVTVTATDSRGTVETSSKSNAIGPIASAEVVNAPTLLTPVNGSTGLSVDSITLTCSAFSGVNSEYASTRWEVSKFADFSSWVYIAPNTNETSNVATFSTPLDFETTYYARCNHKSITGLESDYSNVNTFTTEADAVNPNLPSATMRGLRFDSARQTTLKRAISPSKDFTFSFWIKRTSDAHQAVWGDDTGFLRVSPTEIYFQASSIRAGFACSVPINEWQHFVLNRTNDVVTAYQNGVSLGTQTAADNFTQNKIWKISGGSNEWVNGYLSEFYFVENAVEPTVFGKKFPDGRWGPLDSSIIKENINTSVDTPYDQRPNGDEVWSGMLTSPGDIKTPTGGFNGLITGKAEGRGGLTFTPTNGIPYTKSVEVYVGGPIKYNVNGDAWVNNPTGNGSTWMTVASGSGTLDTLNSLRTDETAYDAGWNAIKVDGRVLVDNGLWNATQNWSDKVSYTGTMFSGPYPSNLFDGNIDSYSHPNTNTAVLTTFDSLPTGTFELYVKRGGSSSPLKVNGVSITDVDSPANSWYTVTGNTLSSIEVSHNGSGNLGIGAIRLNGEILVDAGATWNTSQVWSANTDGTVFENVNPVTQAYNGDLTNYARVDASQSPATSVFTAVNTNNIVVYGASGAPAGGKIYIRDASGAFVDVTSQFTNASDAIERVEITGVVGISGFKLESTSSNPRIAGIELDGALLVDAASFGSSGFYLPFDPTATGANYTSYLTTTGTWFAGSGPEQAFVAATLANSAKSADGQITFDISSAPIPIGTGIVVAAAGDGSGISVTLNGTEVTSGFSPGWTTQNLNLGSETELKTITLSGPGNIGFIKVNEVTLINYSSIGVDASGQGNNFHDENFGIGDSSQTWSKNLFVPGGLVSSNFSIQGAFDGSYDGPGCVTPNSGIIEFNQDLTVTESLGLVTERQNKVTVYDANGNAEFTTPLLPGDGTLFTISRADLDAGGIGQTITKIVVQDITSADTYLYAILVDGIKLIDPSFVDTVTDTPLKSYAVLEEGSNGNLVVKPSSTLSMSTIVATSFPIYAEFTVLADADSNNEQLTIRDSLNTQIQALQVPDAKAGDVYGIAITETTRQWYKNGATEGDEQPLDTSNGIKLGAYNTGSVSKFAANFGQQPFIYPQAGYKGLYQTWDEYATFGLFVYDANQGKAIRTFELNKTYGLQDVLTAANIFRLTAQPRYKVISYIENNGEYVPLEDVSEQLIEANATISSLQNELDTTQAELATASASIATSLTARAAIEVDVDAILTRLSGLEADEIVDDATDTTLLTAFASLVARVEALENA